MKPLQWVKIVLCLVLGVGSVYLFVVSLSVDYRLVVAREQVRFRQEMPTMDSWINSPFGKLKNYVFNVTNAEAFRAGRDKRLKVQEIGPITYNIVGFNEILERNATTLKYSKHRYRIVEFLPEESVAPDVLNWTITSTNNVLLGAAAKLKHEAPLAALGFDAVFAFEDEFVTNTVYYFLWEFTRPLLQGLSKMSNMAANVGVLHNVSIPGKTPSACLLLAKLSLQALKDKREEYTVNIGPESGLENFFRIEALNDEVVIREQLKNSYRYDSEDCPFNVSGGLDNSSTRPSSSRTRRSTSSPSSPAECSRSPTWVRSATAASTPIATRCSMSSRSPPGAWTPPTRTSCTMACSTSPSV